MSGPPGIEEACEEIIALKASLREMEESREWWRREYMNKAQIAEAAGNARDEQALLHNGMVEKLQESVQLELFWKRCAEQALRLWEACRDEHEDALEIIKTVLSDGATNLSHRSWHALEALVEAADVV